MRELNHTKESGYTLIELLVSLTLFTIVALAMATALFTINAAWKRVQAMKTVMDNLNFAVEAVSRNIRTANTIICDDRVNCSFSDLNGGSEFVVMNTTLGEAKKIEYGRVYDTSTGVYQLKKREDLLGTGAWSNWIAMTTPEISIDFLRFYVEGAEVVDGIQPNVMMIIQGTATAAGQAIPFNIQTLVSQRNAE